MKHDDDDIQEYINVKRFNKKVAEVNDLVRNDTLEEVAREFDKMPFGDTAASFAIFVRNMKK